MKKFGNIEPQLLDLVGIISLQNTRMFKKVSKEQVLSKHN